MSKCRLGSLRRMTFWIAVVSLPMFALVLPAPLHAGKKKTDPPPPVSLGDQRVKAYFDISKIVWPNPPAIPRIAFQNLFTGEKIDPSLYAKKAAKHTWMDRLAGAQDTSQVKAATLPFQLVRTYGVAIDSKGKIYAADQAVGAVFIFDPENNDHVELIGHGRQANLDMIAGLALDDDDRLFVTDAKLHHVLVFNAKHLLEAVFGAEMLSAPAVWPSIGRTGSSM